MVASKYHTMPAVKKAHRGVGLDWTEGVPVPQPGPREVLIGVTHAGICGTDRHIYQWDAWSSGRVPLGTTIGHEMVGRVAAVGPGVSSAQVGDRVSVEGHIGCGRCEQCRTGNAHICEDVQILGIDRDGCFAPLVVVPEDNLWPVHPDIPDHVAAVLDPLGNAMHTVMEAGVSGRSVLITGVGTIGLMAVSIAKAAGATQISVADVDPRKLALAEELGADIAIDARQPDWSQRARRLSRRSGAEVLLEMSGHAGAIDQGLRAVRNGATVALLGLPAEPVLLDLSQTVIFKGLKLLGINGRRIFRTWYQVEDFLLTGKLDMDRIITHQLPLEDFQRGFELLELGEAIKVVLEVPPLDAAPSLASAGWSYEV